MNVLVTAGATQVPIDRVRSISNIFRGRTGLAIANYFSWPDAPHKSSRVTLITSDPETAKEASRDITQIEAYKTFDELEKLMRDHIVHGGYDIVIHSAAVSDYKVSRVLDAEMKPLDTAQKISSQHRKMYLELTPTIKLVDQIREPWGFTGKLVKFKLQVGIGDQELIEIANKSRAASKADLIVANCLEWARHRAYILGEDICKGVSRADLAKTLCTMVSM